MRIALADQEFYRLPCRLHRGSKFAVLALKLGCFQCPVRNNDGSDQLIEGRWGENFSIISAVNFT